MKNCDFCKKQLLVRLITTTLNVKSKEIEMNLNLSKSVVSRYMTGERGCIDIDIYIIEKIFGIKVKDYSVND
jgi:hypothetical protein